ncbi:MAG: Rrf2 family transcriptional regulator [Gemmatimonadaceae bacterium]
MNPLPQTTEYALRAVLELARSHPRPVAVATLAAAVGAPANYLSKTLSRLVRSGVLTASRGPAGGFRLVDAPERVTLEQIVRVFVQPGPNRCLLGPGPCGAKPDCPVHARWIGVADVVNGFFESTTLADLAGHTGDVAPSVAAPGTAVFPSDHFATTHRTMRSL